MELLVVIALLSIILLIATPTIIGIVEDAKKDMFSKSVLSVINATKMDIVSKVYEDAYIYTLDGGIEYAVHNETYCVKKTPSMKEATVENYTGKCDFITSEKCFAFSKGSITNYYDNEENNSSNPKCPRDIRIPETINGVTVTEIGVAAFDSKNITSEKFPTTLESIGTYAFYYNKLSGELDLSNTKLISIGNNAFGGRSSGSSNQIISIKFPSSLTNIGNSTFRYNALTSVTFYGRSDLTGITIGTNV